RGPRVPADAHRARPSPAAFRPLRILSRAPRGEGPARVSRLDRAARQPGPPRREVAGAVPVRRVAAAGEPRPRTGAEGGDRSTLREEPAGGIAHRIPQDRA